jgi:RNA polymerase sigma-70 factor (ECF subfamily)
MTITSTTIDMRETTLIEVEQTGEAAALPMDEDTFRAFYDRTARSVWLYLARVSGDRQLADDLVQETYYRFFRAAATYESESHRRNSLFRIATNIARDAERRGKHRRHVPLPDVEHDKELVTASDDIAGRTDLARAMAHLRPAQREMIWLAYALGSSHQEIAEALGLRTGSIKPLLFRARRKLAQLLGGSR